MTSYNPIQQTAGHISRLLNQPIFLRHSNKPTPKCPPTPGSLPPLAASPGNLSPARSQRFLHTAEVCPVDQARLGAHRGQSLPLHQHRAAFIDDCPPPPQSPAVRAAGGGERQGYRGRDRSCRRCGRVPAALIGTDPRELPDLRPNLGRRILQSFIVAAPFLVFSSILISTLLLPPRSPGCRRWRWRWRPRW